MKRESRTVDRSHQGDSPTQRHLPLVDLLVDTRAELMELAVSSGLQVLTTLLEEDRTAICGPRYVHSVERQASRAARDAPDQQERREPAVRREDSGRPLTEEIRRRIGAMARCQSGCVVEGGLGQSAVIISFT